MAKINKKIPTFLVKVYEILENNEYQQIISWNEGGDGFIIYNPTEFSAQVLPTFYKHSNIHSFIRQLNMYGFNKKRKNKIENYYHHPHFVRNQKDLLMLIQRRIENKCNKDKPAEDQASFNQPLLQEESPTTRNEPKHLQQLKSLNQFNYLLLWQQIANFESLKKDLGPQYQQFSAIFENYVNVQTQLYLRISKLSKYDNEDEKKQENMKTEATIKDRSQAVWEFQLN